MIPISVRARGEGPGGPGGAAARRRALRHLLDQRSAVPRLGDGRAAARARAGRPRGGVAGAGQPGDDRGRAGPGRDQRQRGLPAADPGAGDRAAGDRVPPDGPAGDQRDAPAVRRGRVPGRRPGGAARHRRRGAPRAGQDDRGVPVDQPGRAAVVPRGVGRGGRGDRARPGPGAADPHQDRALGSERRDRARPGRRGHRGPAGLSVPGGARHPRLRRPAPPAARLARHRPGAGRRGAGRRGRSGRRGAQQYDVGLSSPRYAWPLLVRAATAAIQAPGEDATALLDRLRALAEKLEVVGPVQQAWQLSFAALDPAVVLDLEEGGGGRARVADAAAATWQSVGQPYQEAIALVHAARIALAERAAARHWPGCTGPRRSRSGSAPARALGVAGGRPQPPGRQPRPDEPGLTAGNLRCSASSRPGSRTGRSPPPWSSRPRRPAFTCPTSWPSWAPATRTEAAVKAHELGLLGFLAR